MDQRKKIFRSILLGILLICIVVLVQGYISTTGRATQSDFPLASSDIDSNFEVAPHSDGITVITTQNIDSSGRNGRLIAIAANGSLLYKNDSFESYWDVDPISGTKASVIVVADEFLNQTACQSVAPCTRNVILRVNLSTGSSTVKYHQITTRNQHTGRVSPEGKIQFHGDNTRWHDVDRVGQDTYLVADIDLDRVFVINTTSGLIEWEWNAQSDFNLESGGTYPAEWTHVNDVERLPDGRIMVSLRNLDQVVFIHPERGMLKEWTLGADNDHDILYEQHNPDYIPRTDGGPSILVGDSENNRIAEYHYRNGSWVQSWIWSNLQMQWPRDADRLPNCHTLITDSNGDRVIEVNKTGSIIWEISVRNPYEAERFYTGDESANGPTARQCDLENQSATSFSSEQKDDQTSLGVGSVWLIVRSVIPSSILNAGIFLAPSWMGPSQYFAFVGVVLISIIWMAVEARWANIKIQSPIKFE